MVVGWSCWVTEKVGRAAALSVSAARYSSARGGGSWMSSPSSCMARSAARMDESSGSSSAAKLGWGDGSGARKVPMWFVWRQLQLLCHCVCDRAA